MRIPAFIAVHNSLLRQQSNSGWGQLIVWFFWPLVPNWLCHFRISGFESNMVFLYGYLLKLRLTSLQNGWVTWMNFLSCLRSVWSTPKIVSLKWSKQVEGLFAISTGNQLRVATRSCGIDGWLYEYLECAASARLENKLWNDQFSQEIILVDGWSWRGRRRQTGVYWGLARARTRESHALIWLTWQRWWWWWWWKCWWRWWWDAPMCPVLGFLTMTNRWETLNRYLNRVKWGE